MDFSFSRQLLFQSSFFDWVYPLSEPWGKFTKQNYQNIHILIFKKEEYTCSSSVTKFGLWWRFPGLPLLDQERNDWGRHTSVWRGDTLRSRLDSVPHGVLTGDKHLCTDVSCGKKSQELLKSHEVGVSPYRRKWLRTNSELRLWSRDTKQIPEREWPQLRSVFLGYFLSQADPWALCLSKAVQNKTC